MKEIFLALVQLQLGFMISFWRKKIGPKAALKGIPYSKL